MGLMTGITALSCGGLMTTTPLAIACFLVAVQAELFLIIFELEGTWGAMAAVTGEAFTVDHGLMSAANRVWLFLFCEGRLLDIVLGLIFTGTGAVTVKTDLIGWFGQECRFVTGMDGVAGDTGLISVGFVQAASSGHWGLVTVEAELVGRGAGCYPLLFNLVAGLTFALTDGKMEVFLEEAWRIAGMGRVTLETGACHRIVIVRFFKRALLGGVAAAALGVCGCCQQGDLLR